MGQWDRSDVSGALVTPWARRQRHLPEQRSRSLNRPGFLVQPTSISLRKNLSRFALEVFPGEQRGVGQAGILPSPREWRDGGPDRQRRRTSVNSEKQQDNRELRRAGCCERSLGRLRVQPRESDGHEHREPECDRPVAGAVGHLHRQSSHSLAALTGLRNVRDSSPAGNGEHHDREDAECREQASRR